ncbi:MAG: TrbI/VirB10 family protein [Methylacidiphilaceae bacterium]|nr:TrbI/VirB10 family protein [Candidatus Methylacidiphilaceae bacterium]
MSRRFINWLLSAEGKLVAFIGLIVLVCAVVWLSSHHPEPSAPPALVHRKGSVEAVPHESVIVPRPRPKPQQIQRPVFVPLVGYQSQIEAPPTDVVPYGTLIPAVVTTPADSTDAGQPIIAVVTEDVYTCSGRLAIPCKTLLHGHVGGESSRRVLSRQDWVAVFQDGKELNVKGTILSNGDYHDGHFNVLDGQIGMYGDKKKEGGFLGLFAKGFIRTYPATPVYLYLEEALDDTKATIAASNATSEQRDLAEKAVEEKMALRPTWIDKVAGRHPDVEMRASRPEPKAAPATQQPPVINWQTLLPPQNLTQPTAGQEVGWPQR